MNNKPATTYSDLIKKAQAYLDEKKQAVSNERGEGTGTPATDIEDKTKKPTPGDALKPQPDATPSKENLPVSGGVDSSKKQPESATASGALEGNRGNSPTDGKKEPAVSTDDVMSVNKRGEGSKVALDCAKLANDILTSLGKLGSEEVKTAADEKKEFPPEAKKDEKKEDKKETPAAEKKDDKAPAAEKKEASPAAAPAPVTEKPADKPAELSEMSRDLYAKIAMVILETDEGKNLVEKTMRKKAGEEAARAVLLFNDEVAREAAEFDKAANDYKAGQEACDRLVIMLQQAPVVSGTQTPAKTAAVKKDQDALVAFHAPMIEKLATEEEKVAYGAGAEAMGAMAESGGAAPEMDAGAEAGGGEVTMEDIAAALSMLVEEGAITPEIAQQLIAQLSGGGEAAAPAAGAPPAEEAPAAPTEKVSSLQKAGAELAARLTKLAGTK